MKQLNPRNWPIIVRLTLSLLVAALIPMAVTAALNLVGSLYSLRDTEYANLQLLAKNTASRLDQLMFDIHGVVTLVAGDEMTVKFLAAPSDARDGLKPSMAETLDNALFSNETYQYVYLVDTDGSVPISRQIDDAPSIEGLSVSNREYFQRGMQGEDHIDFLVGKTSGELGLYFSTSVLDEKGEIVGVAVIKILGEAIWDIVNNIELGESGHAFLIDQDGVIVSHKNTDWLYHSVDDLSREVQERAGQRFRLEGCTDPADLTNCAVPSLGIPELGEMIQVDKPGQTSYEAGDTARQIVGYAPMMQHLRWVVAANKSEDEFTAPLRRLALQSALIVVAVGVIVIALAVLVAQGIARPVSALTQAAESIEADVTHFDPVPLEGTARSESDIGRLARVFIRMAQEVKAREERLKQQVMELRIEIDQVKKEKEVIQIVESDAFQEARARAKAARERRAGAETPPDSTESEPDRPDSGGDDPFGDLQARARAMRQRKPDADE
ncbi:MAG: HAMP domain-containing protein [Anaerolineae bacterium]|nr:HAMP domain-containing protein [Anaerolineae bacterium]